MGNDLINENEYKDKEPKDEENEFIRYGIISQKWGEKSNDDSYLSISNLTIPDKDKKINYSLFGVFDGHNSDYVSNYVSNNIHELYKNEIININKENYKAKIQEIFKTMDKNLRGGKKGEQQKDNKADEIKEKGKDDNKNENKNEENNNVINENNKINESNKDKEKNEEINYIDVSVDERELKIIKDALKNSKDIPEELKKDVDDSEIENLLLFKNLFQYNNNFLYHNNNLNYIGSSASIVLINDDSIITADLGITKCILFNKEGNIINIKDSKESKISKDIKDFNDKDSKNSKDSKTFKNVGDYKNEHTFNNLEEKKRIKKFNKTIDYGSLKINFYVPASRCFGFFKYKDNEILKEENQIISCVPDVYIYNKKDVNFILLLTKGAFPSTKSLKSFKDILKNLSNDDDNKEIKKEDHIKLSKLICDYIKNKKEEEKNNSNIVLSSSSTSTNKPTGKAGNSIYVGKEDFGEENTIINELNSTYYKDIMSLNKTNNCNGNYNATCILIQLLKKENEKENITPGGDNLQENNKEKDNKIEVKNVETPKPEPEIKSENKVDKENKTEIVENKEGDKKNENMNEKEEEKNKDKSEDSKDEVKKDENETKTENNDKKEEDNKIDNKDNNEGIDNANN